MKILTSIAAMLFSAAAAFAQQPLVSNGQLQTAPLAGSLAQTLRAAAARTPEPVWIGYAVPIISGDRNMCCWNGDGAGSGCCTGCRLEPGASSATNIMRADSVRLEAGDSFFVLYRFEQGQLNRIRMFSEGCPLDAGGRTIQWLTGVRPAESVSVLAEYANEPNRPSTSLGATVSLSNGRKISDSALSALAMHAEPTALDTLVKLARNAPSTHVRSQGLFWLAQRAGQKAVGTITDAINNDPETSVKRQAVFALSQLPREEGVPLLINVARTNANPAVKKQAIFWLGQSKDPRALQFFEEILFKK